MNYKKTFDGSLGYTKLCEKGKSTLSVLEYGILKLDANMSHTFETGEKEMAVVILGGRAKATASGRDFGVVGGRRNVFSGTSWTIFAPRHNTITLTATEHFCAAICEAPSKKDGAPVLIKPEDVTIKNLGKFNWAREAHFIVDEKINATNLYIGEAFINPGGWASFPPHKHDVDDMPNEAFAEELYFYQYNMPQAFGFQRVYTDDKSINETYLVENNDLVEMPCGYHPFACAPGYYGYYLWVMGGENRGFYMNFQKEHAWINAMDTFLTKNNLK